MQQHSTERYGGFARFLHWATAIIVLIAFIFGPGGSEEHVYSPQRDFDRHLHETLGLCVLALVVVRVIWRMFDTRPEPPPVPRWMDVSAKAVQGLLYVLLFALPITAITGAWLEGHPLTLLGGVEIPPLVAKMHATGATIATIHTWLGDAILWLAGAILGRIWECKDGYVYAMYWGGASGPRWNSPLVRWMESEGVATEFIKGYDWETLSLIQTPPEILEQIAAPTRALFQKHTKEELLEGALEHNAQVYPLNSTAEIAVNPQLAARDYWVELEHPELGVSITYPGPWAKTTEAPPRVTRRAPLIGEHNEEIYVKEMGYSEDKLRELKRDGII
ncbi:MAG: cytochrome b/b6 domain-containing protein [Gammaproteobacteria bacterium]